MTTIAWDGRVLAGDRQAMSSSGAVQETTKIRKYNGELYAVCGCLPHSKVLLKWVLDGGEFPKNELVEDGNVIHIDREGRVWKFEGSPEPFLVESVPCAFGSGALAALIAMREVGLGAAAAVAVAAKYDIHTGGAVDALMLHDSAEGELL